MLINKDLSREIYEDAGEARISNAKEYIDDGKISIIKSDYQDQDNFSLTVRIKEDSDEHEVHVDVIDGELEVASCDCPEYKQYYSVCKHIVAAFLKFEQTKFWENDYKEVEELQNSSRKNDRFKYKSFTNLINSFYNDELDKMNSDNTLTLSDKDKIKIEPKIDYDKFTNEMKLEIKIGRNRMYKIKDLPEFYTKIANNEYVKYGENLEFLHNRENFEDSSKDLLDFILRYAEIMKYTNSNDKYGYY